jgi:hypothetical protein
MELSGAALQSSKLLVWIRSLPEFTILFTMKCTLNEIDFRLPITIVLGDVCKTDGVRLDIGDIDANMSTRSAVVSIVNRPRVGWFGVRPPVGLRHFSPFQNSQSGSGPTHPPLKWEPVFFFRVKAAVV